MKKSPSTPPLPLDEPDPSAGVWSAARGLLVITTMLTAFGLTMLYSASYGTAGLKYFSNQLIWITIGAIGGLFVFFTGYKRICSSAKWWMIISFLLLVACFFFKPINGATRWIRFGGISIQPSEFAKLAVAIFVAKYCAENPRTFTLLKHRRGLLVFGAMISPVILAVLLGRDLGTTVLISAMSFLTLLVAGLYWRYSIIPIGFVSLTAVYIWLFDPMRTARVTSFLRPEEFQQGKGYQLWNSLLALGSGNWFGVGFMSSHMKAKYLPEAHTDFIISIVGEELGYFALIAVILLYAIYCFFALRIAVHARNRLGTLLGFALTMGIVLQAVINLAVVSGSAPTKGMPAPFISYGGSNMIACLLATSLLISIAFDVIEPDYEQRFQNILPWKKTKR